jgi:GalNAc-alpha-(1->4)-GalNAc-alpha-(1->3)-diNAcBac-PP-undecaprenol alpha-1,4-N-acetyl-D-galactosaminyltransferase
MVILNYFILITEVIFYMKKVMFVTGVLSNGGAERVISILAKEFCETGHDVSILTIFDDKNDYVIDKKIKIYSITHQYKNRLLKSFRIFNEIRKLFKKHNPDIIISFDATINIYTILSSAFLKNKIIISERNDPYNYPENKHIRNFRDFLYRYSDGYVFQTEDARNYFQLSVKEKSTIIPNPILSNLPYWNERSQEKIIITASRLSKQKNLPMLITAFSKFRINFPEYTLKIFGNGELREELLVLIDQLGLQGKVLLQGFSNNIHSEMQNSDLFIISSDYEGISNAMLEALAIGVPVISTDSPIGGAKMFIRSGENGILIKVGDTDQLVRSMNKVISNKGYATLLSYESRKIRNELSSKAIVEKWVKYAEEVYRNDQ